MANYPYYYVEIWNPRETEKILKFSAFSSLEYEDTIDKGGQSVMTIPYTRPELGNEMLGIMNRVKIFKGDDLKWEGFTTSWEMKGNMVTMNFLGLMSILEKRIVHQNYGSQQASAIFQDILSDMNSEDDTGISFGVFEGTEERAFNFNKQTVLSAIREIVNSIGTEFFVDLGGIAKVVLARGEDKGNGELDFKLLDNRPNESNIQEIDVITDGTKLYNRIELTTESLSSVRNDTVSRDEFTLLHQVGSSSGATDIDTLNAETQRAVDIFGTPIQIPSLRPISERIDESEYQVGDNVGVKLQRGFFQLDDVFRIISKKVTVRRDGQSEDVEIGISDRPISRIDILSELATNNKRVYNLERAL